MPKLQKFAFDLDFGAPSKPEIPELELDSDLLVEVEPEEPPPPPPMFSEEDIGLAREQAFAAGHAAGIHEAESATERLLANSLESIGQRLSELIAAHQAASDLRVREAIEVAMAVIRKLQPEMARLHALDEIEGVVHECLSQLDREVRVTLRINPAHVDDVRERAEQAARATAFEGKLVFSADPRVVIGDCRVEWGDGGVERDQAGIWAEIDAVVARALGEDVATASDIAVPA
jgi:flagellar assembly protein FliH